MKKREQEKFEELTEDFATQPVPGDVTTNGYHIALINSGLVISWLTMVTGVLFGLAIGVMNTIYVTLISSAFLVVVGIIAGIVGSKTRLSSYMLMKFSFGAKGALLINLVLAISLLGWFGVTLDLLGDGAQALAQQEFNFLLPKWLWMLIGGVLITTTSIFGFRGLNRLAPWLTPIMALVMVVVVYKVLQMTSLAELMAFEGSGEISIGVAISASIGSLISMMIAMPDFTRYVKTPFDSVVATFFPLLIAQPLVYTGAAIAAVATQQYDLLLIMIEVGLGLFAFILIVASTWISNAIALYSCSLGLASVLVKVKKWKLEVLSGVVGTLMAIAGIMDYFIVFLESLSFIFVPIGSVYLSDYYFISKQNYEFEKIADGSPVSIPAMLAMLIGIAVYYGSSTELCAITPLPAVDSLVVTTLVYLLSKHLGAKYYRNVVEESVAD